eukprot:SAG31_NODE_599_length_13649_cov_9.930775_13_plen_151_part_00
MANLAAEAVQSAALTLQCVDDVHSGHGLAAGVLGVGDSVTDDRLHEGLQDTAGLLVDQAGDALDATTAGQSADCRLGDALDVVPEHLTVTLGATLSESLSSLSASGHCLLVVVVVVVVVSCSCCVVVDLATPSVAAAGRTASTRKSVALY